jgi:hypothetical protein
MIIPVFYIHSTNNSVIKKSCLKAAENNEVILISDFVLDHQKIKNIDLDDYGSEDCEKFSELYEHMSSNSEWIERFCFYRWFILLDYMKKNNLEVIFYCDSDMLLFCDVSKEYYNYKQFDMTLTHQTASISSFISINALESFCEYVMKTYSNKENIEYSYLNSKWDIHKKYNVGGGICDMTLLRNWSYQYIPNRIGEMMHIYDGKTWDHNINVSDGVYDHDGRIKKIKFIEGIPYCFNKKLNQDIKFNSLHFQGPAKNLINNF